MPTKWRTVRVFISSTFRDMHATRDNAVEHVFGEQRDHLAPYLYSWEAKAEVEP